jgi:hypothetical protein
MLNMSLGCAELSLSDVARRLGIAWRSDPAGSSSAITLSAPWLYYMPSKPGAPVFDWQGRQVGKALELGVAATVDVPAFGITATRASLLVSRGGAMVLQVRGCQPDA